jgi:hypothetical protein
LKELQGAQALSPEMVRRPLDATETNALLKNKTGDKYETS